MPVEMRANPETEKPVKGHVHCPICTHTVPADIYITRKRTWVAPGQKCPRCASTLDVAYVLGVLEAA